MIKRPEPGSIPEGPGSYQFLDNNGQVLYVGKAKNLRHRINSYFGKKPHTSPRTNQMLSEAEEVEWIQVKNELESLLLEFNLIKEHRPRFNIDLKDDKSYPYLSISLDQEWPRAAVVRERRRKGSRYFGPYVQVGAIRDTLDLLIRSFPVRTCSDSKLREHQKSGKPCLLFHIEKCCGPCVGEVTNDEYQEVVNDFMRVVGGDTKEVEQRLNSQMSEASERLEYETAARFRDQLKSVRQVMAKQQIVGNENEQFDIIVFRGDELQVAVQVFYVRHGKVVGRKGSIMDRVEETTTAELLNEIISSHYRNQLTFGIPRAILVEEVPAESELLCEWLRSERGGRVQFRVPERGGKKELLKTVSLNAEEEFVRHRMKRASDHNSRSRALNELQMALDLPNAPLRIECYDMSHLQGTDYVGSMVVLEDGIPVPSAYRRFKIKEVKGNDDYAAMEEVLRRRLTSFLKEESLSLEERSTKFAYPPQLLLVDGGRGQLGVALRVVEELGLEERIPVAAIAKRLEEIFLPGIKEPILLPRASEALYLLQRVRDESHRFAVEYHRKLRSRRMTGSVLDGVSGFGVERRKRLIKEMGGVKAIQNASREELMSVSWLPNAVAESLYEKIHRPASRQL
ncbi:MAG: UvrABC system protein C [Acidimicrobiales bacterium AG-410-I20]|nr:MAG: UvrABC system protein C [Acidimicrobiales bacterium AG-410-I20]